MDIVGQLYAIEAPVILVFHEARAVGPGSAIVPPAWRSGRERRIFARFARAGALRETADGRCYLDEARLAAYARRRRHGLAIYCTAVVVVVLVLSLVVR